MSTELSSGQILALALVALLMSLSGTILTISFNAIFADLFPLVSIPIYPVFNVNVLQLTDGQISLGSTLFYTTMMLASFGLGFLSTRLGHWRVLIVGSLLFGLYPLLIGLAWDATLFWLASIAGGFAWGITNGVC
jgi:MFS family permease